MTVHKRLIGGMVRTLGNYSGGRPWQVACPRYRH